MIPQFLIVALGVTAAWLVASKERRWRHVAGWLGIIAQPCWVWTFIEHEQYPMLLLCLLYGASWVRCVVNNGPKETQ